MPGAMTFIPGSPRKVPGPVFLFLPVVMNHTITLLPCPIWTVGSFLSFLLPRSYLVPLSLGVETGFWLCVCAMADKSEAAEEGRGRQCCTHGDVCRGLLKWVAAVCSRVLAQ